MKKRFKVLVVMTVLSLLLSACGGSATTAGTSAAATSPVAGQSTTQTQAEQSSVSESVAETTTTTAAPKVYIKAEEDNFAWPAPAAETDFDFNAESGSIDKYNGNAETVVIPEKITGQQVLQIGLGAFDQNPTLTNVKIPEGVRLIMGNGFYSCLKLERVSLPESLEAIDSYAFFGNEKLPQITFPAALAYVGDNAFAFNLNLEKVRFLGACPLFGASAFDSAETQSKLSFTVADEEQAAFSAALGRECQTDGACNYLEHPVVESDWDFDKASGTITAYKGVSAVPHVPAQIAGTAVKLVGEKAFSLNQRIRRVFVEEGIQEIAKEAFSLTQLIEVQLPVSIKKIADNAFSDAKLTVLNLPEGLEGIGAGAFFRNRLTEVHFPSTLKKVGAKAFSDNGDLGYLVFAGKTMPEIAADAFANVTIADIDIAVDASKAEENSFRDAWIKSQGAAAASVNFWRANPADLPPYPNSDDLVFDEVSGLINSYSGSDEELTMFWDYWKKDGTAVVDVKGLGLGVFEGANLKRFVVPRSGKLVSIGERAFANSQLAAIDLFDSVTHIGAEAFANCVNLKEIVIPDSVVEIGANAFSGCTNLEKVIFKGKDLSIGADAFTACEKLQALELPQGVKLAGNLGIDTGKIRFAKEVTDAELAAYTEQLGYPWYETALRVGEDSSFKAMPDSYKPNPDEDFEFDAATGTIRHYLGKGGEVVVPSSISGVTVENIGGLAFSNLTIATVASGTAANETLQSVVIPETVKIIEDSAFLQCETLKKVECYGAVERLGIRAFENCKALEEVIFVNGLKEMGVYCFNYCESLVKVDFNGKLKNLPEGAFVGCGFNTEQILDYETVGDLAFKECKALPSARVTAKVQSFGAGVFVDALALKTVYFERPDPAILGGNPQFTPSVTGLKIVLPKTATDEEVRGFISGMQLNMLAEAETMVVKE